VGCGGLAGGAVALVGGLAVSLVLGGEAATQRSNVL
jgi:hypothetical protein